MVILSYHAPMGRNIISQLTNKRRRLHGELLECQKAMLKLKSDIAALDHTLMVMDYEGIPSDLKPIKTLNHLFAKRELPKLIAIIHRERPDLPTDTLIAAEIISRKGWDKSDTALLDNVRKKVLASRHKLFRLNVASSL